MAAAWLCCTLMAPSVCVWHGADSSCWAAGICTMTCHKAHNVFDVVPGDVVGSVILTTAAATVQVHALHLTEPDTRSLCPQLLGLCISATTSLGSV